MKTCWGCGLEYTGENEEGLCDECFADDEESKAYYEAEKQYQDKNMHWDIGAY